MAEEPGIKYSAPPIASEFIRCRDKVVFIKGPIGSGKSVACCMKILRIAMQQHPGLDGIRRTRHVVVRNTSGQLRDTTIKTWLAWFPDGSIGKWKSTDMTYVIGFIPPDGIPVYSEVLFRALDDPADVAKVLSLESTSFWFNETREIVREIIEAAIGRVGRFPDKKSKPPEVPDDQWPSWVGVFGDTNAPESDGYWYNVFEHLPADDYDPESTLVCTTFAQPGGDTPEAENIENLPANYYAREGRSAEWFRTMVQVQYGRSLHGVPVYEESFKEDHLSRTSLRIDPLAPVIVGLDTARTPAACFMQRDPYSGQLVILRECVAFGMGAKTFIKTKMRPIIRQWFPQNPIIIIADPSFVRRNETDDNSWASVLKDEFPRSEGHRVRPAATNDTVERINALDNVLSEWPRGVPMLQFDPAVKWVREGLRGKYRYLRLRGSANNGKTQASPDKNNWSHVVEALQYGAMFANSKHYNPADYERKPFNPFARQESPAAVNYHAR